MHPACPLSTLHTNAGPCGRRKLSYGAGEGPGAGSYGTGTKGMTRTRTASGFIRKAKSMIGGHHKTTKSHFVTSCEIPRKMHQVMFLTHFGSQQMCFAEFFVVCCQFCYKIFTFVFLGILCFCFNNFLHLGIYG